MLATYINYSSRLSTFFGLKRESQATVTHVLTLSKDGEFMLNWDTSKTRIQLFDFLSYLRNWE